MNFHNVLGRRYIVSVISFATYPIWAHNNPCNSTLYNNVHVTLRLLEFHSINLYGDALLPAGQHSATWQVSVGVCGCIGWAGGIANLV